EIDGHETYHPRRPAPFPRPRRSRFSRQGLSPLGPRGGVHETKPLQKQGGHHAHPIWTHYRRQSGFGETRRPWGHPRAPATATGAVFQCRPGVCLEQRARVAPLYFLPHQHSHSLFFLERIDPYDPDNAYASGRPATAAPEPRPPPRRYVPDDASGDVHVEYHHASLRPPGRGDARETCP